MADKARDWKRRVAVVREHLHKLATHYSNAAYTDQIFQEIAAWPDTFQDHNYLQEAEYWPVDIAEFGSSRTVLFQHFLGNLSLSIIVQDPYHFTPLRNILADNYELPIVKWPMVRLSANHHTVKVIGFQNGRIPGGEGYDWEYYYFPLWFVRQYGIEAARKETLHTVE